jgi:hypothetical protein
MRVIVATEPGVTLFRRPVWVLLGMARQRGSDRLDGR